MLTQAQREELRYAVREQLVHASTVALTHEMVQRRVERARVVDFTFSADDLVQALSFLVSLGHAQETRAELGASRYYQATAAGVLAHERT